MKIFLIATFENFYVSVKDNKAVVHEKQLNPLTKVKVVEVTREDSESEFFLVSNDGNYLCAESDNTLVANRSKLGQWEKFKIEKLSENYVAFLSAHGKYLSAEANGIVTASANEISQREKFKLLTLNYDLLKLTEKSDFSSQSFLDSTPNNYFQKAISLEKQGKLEDAVKHYKLSLEKNPNFSWTNYRLAKLLAKQGDLSQALEYYQNAISLQYHHSYFHYDLGLLLESMNNYNGAMSSYLNAIELNPENTRFIEKYRQLCYKKDFFEELMKQNNKSKTEVGNFNLSRVSVNIRDSNFKEIRNKDYSFYHPSIVKVSLNNEPGKPGEIVYHVEPNLGNLSSAFSRRVSTMHQLFTHIVKKHPYFQGTLRLCFGDGAPKKVLINDQNKLFCFSSEKKQKATPIPDVIFWRTQGYSEFRKKVEQNWVNWENRKPCAFWRGSSTGSYLTINNWQDNHRVKLCNLALEHGQPEFLDAKITNICQAESEEVKQVIENSGICDKIVPQIEFIKYKYVIDIDGNVNSWPGLFTKLLTGSCVLKVDSPHYQWYYDRLEPWVSYIPIKRDLSDLMEKINWCREHDNEAKEIGERGRKLALSMTVTSELDWTEKVILKQNQSIYKSLGVTHKGLVSGEVLDNRVLVGTHHKTGTVWMSNIFTYIGSYYDLKYCANGGKQLRYPSGKFDIFFQDHSLFDFNKLSNYKGLHIIRDPRDIIVSGCFYHTKSSEQWLHTKRKKFGGLTYQEKLNSYSSFDDKLMFEMENISKDTIQELESWNYNNPDFIEVKYEDLIEDVNLNLFRNIFQFLGFNEKIMPHLLEIAYKNSLFSGQVSNTKHIRSGKKQQWQEYFKPIHAARFVALFGDILIKLNYDKTQTGWLDK